MADIRALMNFLRDEVALSGDEGLSIPKLWELVSRFLAKDVTFRTPISILASKSFENQDEDGGSSYDLLPPSPLDPQLKEKVWNRIQSDEDLLVGKTNGGHDLTLEDIDIESFSPNATSERNEHVGDVNEWAIYASSKLVWNVIAGHGQDFERISQFQWKLLVIIAAAGPNGISQPDLVARSGQDKRSVPSRTDALTDKGYITKRPIQLPRTRTSLLTLKRFSTRGGDTKKEQAKTPSGVPSFDPAIPNGYDLTEIIRTIMREIRSARNGVMLRSDLRKKLGYEDKRSFSRIFKMRIRRLEQIGCLRRIMVPKEADANKKSSAKPPSDDKISKPVLLKCLKFERDLEPSDWSKALQRVEALEWAGKEEDVSDDENDAEEAAAGDTNLTPSKDVLLPVWTKGELLDLIFDRIEASGESGIMGIDLIQNICGPFIYRPLEKILVRLASTRSENLRPSLRHLGIVRHADQIGRMFVYKYWTSNNYQKMLQSKGISDPSFKPVPAMDDGLDESGFEILPVRKESERKSTFLESQTSAAIEAFERIGPTLKRVQGADGREILCWDRPKAIGSGRKGVRSKKVPAGDQNNPRKRGRPRKSTVGDPVENDADKPPPRKRGRPRKSNAEVSAGQQDLQQLGAASRAKPTSVTSPALNGDDLLDPITNVVIAPPPPRKRGRPRKTTLVAGREAEVEASNTDNFHGEPPVNTPKKMADSNAHGAASTSAASAQATSLRHRLPGSYSLRSSSNVSPVPPREANLTTATAPTLRNQSASLNGAEEVIGSHNATTDVGEAQEDSPMVPTKDISILPALRVTTNEKNTTGKRKRGTKQATAEPDVQTTPKYVNGVGDDIEHEENGETTASPLMGLVSMEVDEGMEMDDGADDALSAGLLYEGEKEKTEETLPLRDLEAETSVADSSEPLESRFCGEDGVELIVMDNPEPVQAKRPKAVYLRLSRESLLTRLIDEDGGALSMVRAFDKFRIAYSKEHPGSGTMDRKTFNAIVGSITHRRLLKQILVQKGTRILGRVLAYCNLKLSSDVITREKDSLVKSQDISTTVRSRAGKRFHTEAQLPVEDISYDRVYPLAKKPLPNASEDRKATLQRIKNAIIAENRPPTATKRDKKYRTIMPRPEQGQVLQPPNRALVKSSSKNIKQNKASGFRKDHLLGDNFERQGNASAHKSVLMPAVRPSETPARPSAPPAPVRIHSKKHSIAARKPLPLPKPSVAEDMPTASTKKSRPPNITRQPRAKPKGSDPEPGENSPLAEPKKPSKMKELESILNFKETELDDRPGNENVFRKDTVRIPRPRRNRKIDTFDDTKLILAVIISRSLFGGSTRALKWDIVQTVMPELSDADLKRNWVRIRGHEKVRIDKLQRQFDLLYLEALESGELPAYDKDDPTTFDLDEHITWFDSVADEANVTECIDLLLDRADFEERYQCTEYTVQDWREPMFIYTSTVTLRKEKLVSQAISVPYGVKKRPVQTEIDIAKRAAKSLLLTDASTNKNEAALEILENSPEDVIKPAFSQLSEEKLVINARGAARIKNHSINSKFFAALKTLIAEETFDQALRFDKAVRAAFVEKGEDDISALVSNGSIAWIVDMLAARKVKLDFGKTALKQSPMGLIDNYQTRGMDSDLINFDLVLRPTKDFDNPLPPHPHSDIPVGKLKSVDNPLCVWQDSNEKVILGMWMKVLKAVLSILVLRPGATEGVVQFSLRPLLNQGDAKRAIDWLIDAKVLRRGDCGGFLPLPKFYSILNYRGDTDVTENVEENS